MAIALMCMAFVQAKANIRFNTLYIERVCFHEMQRRVNRGNMFGIFSFSACVSISLLDHYFYFEKLFGRRYIFLEILL